jgi:hypothetical protein
MARLGNEPLFFNSLLEELFNNAAVRYRVGKVITEAVVKPHYLDEKTIRR